MKFFTNKQNPLISILTLKRREKLDDSRRKRFDHHASNMERHLMPLPSGFKRMFVSQLIHLNKD